MIISDEFCGVKVISLCLGLSRLGPWSEPSLGDLVSHAPAKVKVVKASEVWAGYAPLPEAPVLPEPEAPSELPPPAKVVEKKAYDFSAYGVEEVRGEAASPEVAVYGGVTPLARHFLGMLPHAPSTPGKKALFTRGDRRKMGELLEAGVHVLYAGEEEDGPPANPATVLLENGKDSGQTVPIPGVWKRVCGKLADGIWKFFEPGFPSASALGKTTMPYGTMRIFPRRWGSEAHIDPWVTGEDANAPVLGHVGKGKSLGDMLARLHPEAWANALVELDGQWDDRGDEAEGVPVPVKGVPIDCLKWEYLESQLCYMRGELRQRVRHYVRMTAPKSGGMETFTVGSPEVREFERTCSGHWDARDNFVSTGCVEGHMVRTQFDRELRELLRCEDPRGYRLHPLKAKALARVAEMLHGQPADWLRRAANEIPEGHEEYYDDRPVEGPVEYRGGGQVDRLADSYEQELEEVLGEVEEKEGFDVQDDYEDLVLEDNTVAWQDEYEDLTRTAAPPSGHLAANSPYQTWYGALRTVEKLGRISTRARTPGEDTEEGSYPHQVKAEFNSACQAVRESQRFLAAAGATKTGGKVKLWEGGNLPTTEWFGRWDGRLEETARGYCISKVTEEGTLKSHLEEARKAARQAVADLESGAEAEHCRLAFLKEGLVAHPQLGKWVAKVEPKFVAGLKDSDPELWAALPAAARKVSADRKVTPAAKRKAEAAILTWLADRKEADAVARQEVRLTRSIVKAVEEAVARHREADAKAKAKDEARARRLAVIRQYKGVAN